MLVEDLKKLIKSGKLDEAQVWAVTEAGERCERLDRALEFLDSIDSVARACKPYYKEEGVMEAAAELIMQMACVVP